MMPIASREAELQAALIRYLDTYLRRRDRAGTLALFSPTLMLVGTAGDEVAYDRADLLRIFDRDLATVPDPIEYRIRASQARMLSASIGQTLTELDLSLWIAGQQVRMRHFRLSLLWRREGQDWRLELIHGSQPSLAQGEEESWPLKELEDRARVLERRVAEKTAALSVVKAALEQALAQERQARQARDEFLDRIAHEYRTPLAIIKTQLKLLGLQPSAGAIARHLDRLNASAARLDAIFDQALRAGDATGDTRCQRLDLSAFIAAAVEQVQQSRLALAIPACRIAGPGTSPCWVVADPLLLTTILTNLLDNACKYGLVSAPIQISLRARKSQGAMRLVIRNRCNAAVAVDPATLLERGVRGANSADRPGHGLGLNLASHLARDLGGALQVHLTPDDQFEAWLDLPAGDEAKSQAPCPPNNRQEVVRHNPDDE